MKRRLDGLLRDMRRGTKRLPKAAARACKYCLGLTALLCFAVPCSGAAAGASGSARCGAWVRENFGPVKKPGVPKAGSSDFTTSHTALAPRFGATPPFSFIYDGKPSDEVLGAWTFSQSEQKLDKNRTQLTHTYLDPKTGLAMRVVMVQYSDFPTVEWTLYFRNTGQADTPILEGIQALDTTFEGRAGTEEFKLHHFQGSRTTEADFEPYETVLGAKALKRLTGANGRATGSELCYFNLEMPGGGGLALGLGWPGQWAAEFSRNADHGLRVTCGQELTHLKLHPGEEIRTPRVVMQFWEGGNWTDAQVTWRRWMVEHNMPRIAGKPVAPEFGGCGGNPLPRADEEIAYIEGITKDGVKLDHWIIDAGWYPCRGSWPNTGTWEPDKERFPKGLREVADVCHAKGIHFIVWFEPERAAPDTWLTQNHPEWIIGGAQGGLVNIGNPEAWKWVVKQIDGLLVSEGIDDYRSDYNIGPDEFWRRNDTPDRQGITENLYVQGFLAFWDELLRRHPKMYIDTCSGGGGRLDLETLRRSVPLLRSDWPVVCWTKEGWIGQQCQTHALSLWLPFHGTGAPNDSIYSLRSSYCAGYRVGYDPRDSKRNTALYKQAASEMRAIQPYLLADYYPLTPYSRAKDAWLAWQHHSPEKNEGAIQVFRREDCAADAMQLRLHGLNADQTYALTDADTGTTQKMLGKALMEDGLTVKIEGKPGSALITYKKAN
jgi:alpha-galactosidase